MKPIFKIIIVTAILLPLFSISAETSYELLSPIPLEGSGVSETATASTYIEGVVKLAVALAGALAVIMLIVAGIEYMSTEAFTGKSAAKERIRNALVGLLLVIASFTILATINPKLLILDLSLTRLDFGDEFSALPPPDDECNEEEESCDPSNPPSGQGADWPSDSIERATISNIGNPTGTGRQIVFNRPTSCVKVGEPACTSVWGIGNVVINGIDELYRGCLSRGGTNCSFTISGGTEYWLHGNKSPDIRSNPTNHKPGGNTLDITMGSSISSYIRTFPRSTESGCTPGNERYRIGSGLYVNESGSDAYTGAHWHICYRGSSTTPPPSTPAACNNCVRINRELVDFYDDACSSSCMLNRDLNSRLERLTSRWENRDDGTLGVAQAYPPKTTTGRACILTGNCVIVVVASTNSEKINTYLNSFIATTVKEGSGWAVTLLAKDEAMKNKYINEDKVPAGKIEVDSTITGRGYFQLR